PSPPSPHRLPLLAPESLPLSLVHTHFHSVGHQVAFVRPPPRLLPPLVQTTQGGVGLLVPRAPLPRRLLPLLEELSSLVLGCTSFLPSEDGAEFLLVRSLLF